MDWFGSEYYLKLYRNRNYDEARAFIDAIIAYLEPKSNANFIDIACGRGRHSVYLNSKGYNVLGVDASENSIIEAKKFENETLHFKIRNILDSFQDLGLFQIALNLFTSFGYFDTMQEHELGIKHFKQVLDKDGVLVIDYLNSNLTVNDLVANDEELIDGVTYKINRYVDQSKIIKEIQVLDQENVFNFKEQVWAFTLDDFDKMLQKSALKIDAVFGDYFLNPFDVYSSPRMILIVSHN